MIEVDRVRSVVAEVFGVEPDSVNDDSSPQTIPTWDSLGHLNLVMALEGEFEVSLSVDEALGLGTVERIRSVLREHGVSL